MSDEDTYLAQYRPISIIFQPPTYDDQTMSVPDVGFPEVGGTVGGAERTAAVDAAGSLRFDSC